MDNAMWDKLLTLESVEFIKRVSGDKAILNEFGEEERLILEMYSSMKDRVKDYKVLVILATQWDSYTGSQQANLAVHHLGLYHASRFIMFMDYLAIRFKKGELN